MKNKLQSLKSHLKKLKLIHILLIVLILVVFFGLFKKEISAWKNNNLLSVRVRLIDSEYPCKVDVENPKWREEYNKEIDKCPVTGSALDCIMSAKGNGLPQFIKKDSTCKESLRQQWFWAFGKYWFKI